MSFTFVFGILRSLLTDYSFVFRDGGIHSAFYVRIEGVDKALSMLDDTTGGHLLAFCFLVSGFSFIHELDSCYNILYYTI